MLQEKSNGTIVSYVEFNLSFLCVWNSFLRTQSDTDMLCESIFCGLQQSEKSYFEEKYSPTVFHSQIKGKT